MDKFVKSFNKHRKLVNEHFNLPESEHFSDDPRDEKGRVSSPDVDYELKSTKGEVTKIIATLRGRKSEAFTKLVSKLEELQKLEDAMIALNDEVRQESGREKIAALFGAEFEFTTRVVRTVSAFELVLTKQPKAANTTKWAEVYKELADKLTPELVVVAEAIVKKHTTTQDPKPPGLSINPISEGMGDVWTKFLTTIKSWGSLFDRRLDKVLADAKQL